MSPTPWEMLLLVAGFTYNLAVAIIYGWAVSWLFTGVAIGVIIMVAAQWYLDRRLNKEIMEEINTLTRNYDNQMSIFDGVRHEDLFPKNNNTTEVTRND